MEFWLSRSLSHELFSHDGILAITKPFSRTFFFFHDGILAITEPFSRTFSFFTMEFRLSGSLSHELFYFDGILVITKPFSRTFFFFHDGILAITEPLSRTFFFFHDGILAITEPFSRTFSFFTMEFRLSGSLSQELFSFSRWNFGYHGAFFTNFFSHDGILEIRDLGEDSLYIYITKSIYIGSTSLKTLPLDLEPPLQGKEYGPSYSNATRKRKVGFFSRNYL
jgi:hypothetical protein